MDDAAHLQVLIHFTNLAQPCQFVFACFGRHICLPAPSKQVLQTVFSFFKQTENQPIHEKNEDFKKSKNRCEAN